MTRTMWIAVFCLVGLGPAIAIRVVTPPASLAVEPAQDQSKTELAPNEAAKSDRLELPHVRPGAFSSEVDTGSREENASKMEDRAPFRFNRNGKGSKPGIVTSAQAMPAETPSIMPETTTPGQRWQDANASASSSEVHIGSHEENASNNHKEVKGSGIAPSERPHRRTIARKSDNSAGSNPPKARAEIWRCRQDAMGGLLRALDLSPRCNM